MSMDGQIKWKTGEEPAFNKGGTILADGLLLSMTAIRCCILSTLTRPVSSRCQRRVAGVR